MTPYHPVTWHGACALPILPLKWPIDIAFIHYSAMDQGRSRKFLQQVWADGYLHKFNISDSKRGITWPNFKILGPPNNFWTKRATASNLVQRWKTSCVRTTKWPAKWTSPGSLDAISTFWDTLYNFWTDRSFLHTDHSVNWDELVVVELFSHDAGKTANVIHRNINNNKTANIKGKN